jgi:hypothetical protein
VSPKVTQITLVSLTPVAPQEAVLREAAVREAVLREAAVREAVLREAAVREAALQKSACAPVPRRVRHNSVDSPPLRPQRVRVSAAVAPSLRAGGRVGGGAAFEPAGQPADGAPVTAGLLLVGGRRPGRRRL